MTQCQTGELWALPGRAMLDSMSTQSMGYLIDNSQRALEVFQDPKSGYYAVYVPGEGYCILWPESLNCVNWDKRQGYYLPHDGGPPREYIPWPDPDEDQFLEIHNEEDKFCLCVNCQGERHEHRYLAGERVHAPLEPGDWYGEAPSKSCRPKLISVNGRQGQRQCKGPRQTLKARREPNERGSTEKFGRGQKTRCPFRTHERQEARVRREDRKFRTRLRLEAEAE